MLCAYLRMPYPAEPAEPAESAPLEERLAWQATREVRHTVIRVVRDHLCPRISGSAASWEGCDLDFTGVIFDDAVLAQPPACLLLPRPAEP
ncbi:hypothetical protein [Streptomyces sp. NBC_01294]|uniref:hypothetical protein n=1 Tax=Streptomyces sp. NBC_01294 TaxID=2903815 RepID=UPI002DD7BFF8|nr:hypothetical protein [Streptomyces sp. NBC_01294]WRZ55225.1 hypothetical protein OG534_01215 [Streptomyces sp. NBC_01294]WRZ61474.1 hypothetical protein OG534_36295 [Streptomyces sp. NBC_01294]